jgi:hypothetical protein
MINRPKTIENFENLCFRCLQKQNNINKYFIQGRGYGSSFDEFNTYLQLCNECKKEVKEEWFTEEPNIIDEYCEDYKFEEDIRKFINTLPLESKELFWSRCTSGSNSQYRFITPQDWIDNQLDILPEWKYYSRYKPYRLKVARERFELCNEPVNIVYNDDSKGCWCSFHAHGEYGQKADANTGDKCYLCDQFHKRYENIKEMTDKEFKKYEQIRKAKILLEKEPELDEI